MIKYQDGEIIDLLPDVLKEDEVVSSISYACKMAMKKLVDISVISRMYSDIDSMPEYILDYMAVEMNAQYYDQSFGIDVKRSVIKSVIPMYMLAGTRKSVNDMVSSIFGVGQVVTWDKFTEEPKTPGTFDVITSARMTEDIAERFSEILANVKSASSQLRRILIERSADTKEYMAAGAISHSAKRISNTESISAEPESRMKTGVQALRNAHIVIPASGADM